jgi:choline dehydrogenase-like flavoprotein
MLNERCYWPRGKAVGGTSVINYMIYTRGRAQEWDRIAADGNYGWYVTIIHTYHSRYIPERVADASQIFLRDAHVFPILLNYK